MRSLLLSLSLLFTLLFDSGTIGITTHRDHKTSPTKELHESESSFASSNLTVNLSTATGKTILFEREEHGEINPESSVHDIPHLVLNRNGVPTPGFERTLIISMDHLAVPPSGIDVQLSIETQHVDPDLGRRNSDRIRVWKESRYVPYDARNQKPAKVEFRITFAPTTKLLHKIIPTPTDYFRYRIVISDGKGNRLKSYLNDYAFLMENQWRAPLPKVLEEIPGAAPSELLIYYYDMVPFQTNLRDPDTRIPRQEVGRYIQTELIPQMMKAFEIQTNLWNLPWYKEWSNYRKDEERKTLSVALGGTRTWFHGSAPSIGNAMISIRVDGSFGEYSNMTEGIMSVFHHELFHNQQRNISLHFGSNGNISGQAEAWKLFSEGTAVLASSVGQPEVQFEAKAYSRSFLKRANSFIGSEGAVGGGLNKSYKDIPYHTALYWRFLYENCGGINSQGEDPSTGMKVIRQILETLYKGEIANINSSTDVAGAFPRILDTALQSTLSCRFHSYEESLIQFARAIYMLRLENGRCRELINLPKCGLADESHLYNTPPADIHLMEANTSLEIRGSVPSSYGIDLIQVDLDPSVQSKNLKFVFTNLAASGLKFYVEVWKTRTIDKNGQPGGQSAQTIEPISMEAENGDLILEVQNLSKSDFDGLGIIITRLDPYENEEITGAYSIQLTAQ